jgi:phenylpropionate dioxygenase-like ring-hydroxylating dioxygenase large terminal subunit
MLSKEDNELMCHVGPDTLMGDAIRRYWLPALLISDLPHPDCDPKRVRLVGEDFIAFRDTKGRIGFLDEYCRHRSASLALGRVEDCGIRCIYHGWKFAYDGTVLETPNVEDPNFKTRFKARAFPAREAGGLIWVYLGPKEKEPPFPHYSWFDLPASHVVATVHSGECNFVQIMEGLVDSSHLGLLHMDGLQRTNASDLGFAKKINSMQSNLAPRLEAEDAAYGFNYVALRTQSDANGERVEARVTAFVAPCFIFNPNGDIITIVVPADDDKSYFFHAFWDAEKKLNEEPLRSQHLKFIGLDDETLHRFGIDLGNTDSGRPNRANNFRQDREAMRSGRTFSGLPGLVQEDMAVSVGSGPIRDRSKEMLSAADNAVSRLYRVLINSARRVKDGGDPIGVDPSIDTRAIRGTSAVLAPGQAWQSLLAKPNAPTREVVGAK